MSVSELAERVREMSELVAELDESTQETLDLLRRTVAECEAQDKNRR